MSDLDDAIARNVAAALAEDIGSGDVTAGLVDADALVGASIVAREALVLAGQPWVDEIYSQLDPDVVVDWYVHDGQRADADDVICKIVGKARPILSGERTTLNFLQTLSGTATLTAAFVAAIRGTGARLLDTRKTLPGLRQAQKYAVRAGGGHNHRLGLYDAILIKENHIASTGSITAALARASAQHPDVPMEVEVESLAELEEALGAGAGRIMLDNFTLDDLRAAVALRGDGGAELEASGNVTLTTIRAIAETGVDYISTGAITKNVSAMDLSMLFSVGPAAQRQRS